MGMYGCQWFEYPQIKTENLHFKHMLVSFQVYFGSVQSQNDENCVNVEIFMDLTVRYSMLCLTALNEKLITMIVNKLL